MSDNSKSGIALVAGSIGTLVTMAVHPLPPGAMTVGVVQHLAVVSALAHSLAMVSVLLLVLGAFGLTRRLAAEDRLALSALVVYGFAAIAILMAAAISGFVVPGVMRHMMRDAAAAGPMWRVAIDAVFEINQAFAKIFTVAASAAIVLWSAAALRHGGLGRGLAVYGCVIAPLLVIAVGVGHLQLDVHGMAVVVVAQAIWMIGAGRQLLSAG